MLTGGLSRFGRAAWIVSIAVVFCSLFGKAIGPIYSFITTAIGFFASPQLWLQPMKIWPEIPALPLIALVLLGCAVILAMISVAGVCFFRPIGKFLMMKRRHAEIASHVGLAGRSTYEISEQGVRVCNETGAGERRLHLRWDAFDAVSTVSGFLRLSYKAKPLAHIALRAFGGEEEAVRTFVVSQVNRPAATQSPLARKLSLIR